MMIVNSGDYLIPKDIYDELFSDYIELVQKEEQLEQELEKLKKPINYYQYASKNLKDKNEQLQQENSRLKNKFKDLEEWLEAMASMYENEYKDVNASEHYKCMLHKLKENLSTNKTIIISNKISI